MSSNNPTNYSLIRRALDVNDQEAWKTLDDYYRRFIYYILHEIGTSPDDIQDLTQQVMVLLMEKLKDYDPEKGQFRSWLTVVIRNATYSHFRKMKSEATRIKIFSQQTENTQGVQEAEVESYIVREWEKYISSLAMERTRRSFSPAAISAFELGLEGKTASEIALMTNLKESSVYTLRKRVKKSLYQEVRKLAEQLEG